MKKNKKDKTDAKKEALIVFGVVLVICVFFFSIGMYIKNKANPVQESEYSNGFEFKKVGNSWYTTMYSPGYEMQVNANFRYSPSEVNDIPVDGNLRDFFKLNNGTAYFTFDPTSNLTYLTVVAADLAKYLKVLNGVTLEAACTKDESNACAERPIITCETEKITPVILIKYSEVSGVSMKNNCLTIYGSGEGLLKAYNKVMFLWYGIL